MSIDFLKLNIGIFDHKKIKMIRKYPAGDTIFVIWVWLLCEAMKSDHPGYVYIAKDLPYDKSDIASDLCIEQKTVELAFELFTKLKMVDVMDNGVIEICNFNKHQKLHLIEKARAASRETSKKYRERQKQRLGDMSLTKSDTVDSDLDPDKTKKETKSKITKPPKNTHLKFVLLTTAEYDSLCKNYSKKVADEFIERLNDYIGSTGKKYKSHYYTILNWMRKDKIEKVKKPKRCPTCRSVLMPGGLCKKCDRYIKKADQVE